MNPRLNPAAARAELPPPHADPEREAGKPVRVLIWSYVLLWLLEGALRKWIVPGLSTPLVLVRDPLVLLAYGVAFSRGVFPQSGFLAVGGLLALLMVVASLTLSQSVSILITLFGFRCDFFHVPMIFLMARTMDRRDVEKVGAIFLYLSIPMILIMMAQFTASPGSFWNMSAGGGLDGQMPGSMGRVRPSGTFAFNTGISAYLAILSSFIVYGYTMATVYPRWLLGSSLVCLLLGLSVSVSRHAVVGVVLVYALFISISIFYPKYFGRFLGFGIVVAILGMALTMLPVFLYGLDTLQARFSDGGPVSSSIFGRFLSELLFPWQVALTLPTWGYGLGAATPYGLSAAAAGQGVFAESEWLRVMMEGGFLFGSLYLVYRMGLAFFVVWRAHRSLVGGNALAALIMAASFFDIVEGTFANSTSMGYAILAAGLSLAASKEVAGVIPETKPLPQMPRGVPGPGPSPQSVPPEKPRGRSLYAERLHQSSRPPGGSAS